jgi:TolB-like protein
VRGAVVLGILVLLGAIIYRVRSDSWHPPSGKTNAPQIRSIAVLPLQNLSGDPAQEYFADGMTDGLITDLAQIGSVKVISRTSSMQYKNTRKSLPEVSRELGVDGIVEGTLQRSGNRVRITAQLIYGPSDKHLWAETYEREIGDVFALETELMQHIARQVEARIKSPVPAAVAAQHINLTALEAYLQGNYLLNKGAGDEGMRGAQKYFDQAIAADPTYAPAYIGLAYSHYLLLNSTSNDQLARKISAEKAVVLDPFSSDAHSALGDMKFADWEWVGA